MELDDANDEFGGQQWLDDADMMLAASQLDVNPGHHLHQMLSSKSNAVLRPHKRRRLDTEPTTPTLNSIPAPKPVKEPSSRNGCQPRSSSGSGEEHFSDIISDESPPLSAAERPSTNGHGKLVRNSPVQEAELHRRPVIRDTVRLDTQARSPLSHQATKFLSMASQLRNQSRPSRKNTDLGRPRHSRRSPALSDNSEDEDAFGPSPHPFATERLRTGKSGMTTAWSSKESLFCTPADSSVQPPQGSEGAAESAESDSSAAFESTGPVTARNTHNQISRIAHASNGLHQSTLFDSARQYQGHKTSVPPQRDTSKPTKEPATQHKLDLDAAKTWVYPTNLGTTRDYQFNIVQKGLFNNLLVALPTGLGKTFIAATIMLNYFRWAPESKIVFVAPTKPLVAQQVEACFHIVGIPRSATSMLTGGISPGLRAEDWNNKRVFFMTPQTLINDLKTGAADPKKIVCLVVDEAHRATGSYAYVEVVKFIRRFNSSFRVLALTATPGASVEAVQAVIDGLDISKVEIRTEESIDIRQYVHKRQVETIIFDPSDEIVLMKELLSKALQPILDKLNEANAYWVKDPMSLTPYGLTKARQQWMSSEAGRNASMGFKGMMHAIFSLLASLAHSIVLLNFHGVGPFYHNLLGFREGMDGQPKGSKYRKQVNENPSFNKLMNQARQWINTPDFVGHPKLEYLKQVALNHFLDAGEGRGTVEGVPPSATRVMIFVHFRDSAEEVVRVLKRHEPMIRPHVFVGQAGAKGSDGMNQKTQLEVIQKFQQGVYNTLVATCVGEEGLDIGEVDLIICYDSSASPIRMLQRMGRTGRKRAGKIVVLLVRGKEEDSFTKAKDAYAHMQHLIVEGSRFNYHDDLSPRILPADIHPEVDKRVIDIPLENTQQKELPEPKRRGRAPKRAPKKFHMPDGVRTGFVKASKLDASEESGHDDGDTGETARVQPMELAAIPETQDVVLGPDDERALERRYQNVYGGEDTQIVSMPRLDAFPDDQRVLARVKHVQHGAVCVRMVKMLQAVHEMDDEYIRQLESHLNPDDRDAALSARPTKSDGEDGSVKSDAPSSDDVSPPSTRAPRSKGRRKARSSTNLEDSPAGTSDVAENEVSEELDGNATPDPTPASLDIPLKRFYSPQKASRDACEDSDADLPEVTSMMPTDRTHQTVSKGTLREKSIMPQKGRHRAQTRRVLHDSDDDDD
ncbi:MAG: 3'-5' DNA helicase [Caeruleum heppii]|nr:MAG: 3'-5' DNA helicase [Caeruleum heppii]